MAGGRVGKRLAALGGRVTELEGGGHEVEAGSASAALWLSSAYPVRSALLCSTLLPPSYQLKHRMPVRFELQISNNCVV